MDPERQPLLCTRQGVRYRCYNRPLTHEEVLLVREEVTWRRTRFFLVLMFWAIMVMLLSIITCILISSPSCKPYDVDLSYVPSVSPVHLNFAPLISTGRALNSLAYTL
ncbi:hypothetical protein K1T71_010634 [Dendrolimus kikuchii]|uniref:Uncharacterized protein n=1 Tax=Dendrolimus kikuchii TaxID=765133 RepID=A0ACC1CPP2_9NEOP|nr:hypothetical protein K1T71_010634 [Dendrolimus kikuchii]